MENDIVLNKIQIIERCIQRIREEYGDNAENLNNYTRQDSIILNIQRACEAAIDLAMHVVSEKGLGIPQSSRDVFDIIQESNVIDEALAGRLKAMVGFRNIAVHDYQKIDLDIVRQIIEKHLGDLKEFARMVLQL